MYPILVLAIGVVLAVYMDGVAVQYRDLTLRYQSIIRQTQIISIANNIEQFYQEEKSLPVSLTAMMASKGFEQIRGNIDNWQTYTVSPVLNDGVWQFNRALIFSNDPTRGASAADYLAKNACGSGGFSTAISWCGSKDSRWFRKETRESYNEEITAQRIRMGRMLQKLSVHYNVHKAFPQKDSLGLNLPLNGITRLSTLVGYSGNSKECSGTFSYMNIPVDCGDLFDLWGGNIGYQFVSEKRIILTSETPIINSSSNRVVVAVEYDYSLF